MKLIYGINFQTEKGNLVSKTSQKEQLFLHIETFKMHLKDRIYALESSNTIAQVFNYLLSLLL